MSTTSPPSVVASSVLLLLLLLLLLLPTGRPQPWRRLRQLARMRTRTKGLGKQHMRHGLHGMNTTMCIGGVARSRRMPCMGKGLCLRARLLFLSLLLLPPPLLSERLSLLLVLPLQAWGTWCAGTHVRCAWTCVRCTGMCGTT